jgi:type IV pilus biogenesis protein CpaD/CtpE
MKSTQSLILIAAAVFAGCASAPPSEQKTVSAAEATQQCLRTTGSNICRASDTSGMNQINSISGEDLRRSGGPITGATPGRTGN